jgi:pyruvate kinase
MKKAPKGFLVFTHSGRTARLISRYRPKIPVYAFTSEELVRDQLTLNFGVFPFLEQVTREGEVKKVDVASTLEYLKNKSYVEQGDSLIVLHGDVWAIEGGTSTIKVVTCK